MTKFSKMVTVDVDRKPKKQTLFTHFMSGKMIVVETTISANDFQNVSLIGTDVEYGSVFKCWQGDGNNFTIFFGIAGSEFDDQ